MTVARIKQKALALEAVERIRLVQEIWDSLIKEPGAVPIPKHHKRLIDERVGEHATNPRSAISITEAKRQIRKHLSRRRPAR